MDGSDGPQRPQGNRQSLSRAGPVNLPRVFDQGFRAVLNRTPSHREREQFSIYLDLLMKWGSVHRLVGSTAPEWIVEHLFLDSLLFVSVLPTETRSILDFGAGAGLPGVPIAVVRPESEITLLEARRRRASFLSASIRELRLTNARVVAARAEDMVAELGASFDAVVMRCAGRLEETLPLAATFAKGGGLVVAAGPPKPSPLRLGQWLTVPGVRKGAMRRFAILAKPGQ